MTVPWQRGNGVCVCVGFVSRAPRRRSEKLHRRRRPETRRMLQETGGERRGYTGTGAIAPAGEGAEERNGSRYKGNGTEKKNLKSLSTPCISSDVGRTGTEIKDARGADVPSCPLPSEFSEGLDHRRRRICVSLAGLSESGA